MDAKIVKGLSEIERKTLAMLSQTPASEAEISEKSGLNIDAVRRAVIQLSEKGFAKISEKKPRDYNLTALGEKYEKDWLPERRLYNYLKGKNGVTFREIIEIKGWNLDKNEFEVAIGVLKRANYLSTVKEGPDTKLILAESENGTQDQFVEETHILTNIKIGKSLNEEQRRKAEQFIPRGIVEKGKMEREISITSKGEEARKSTEFIQERSYDIQAPVPEVFGGKKQPYIQFLNIIRRKLTELGFQEMEAPLIVHEFYNFDVLFQPQNHPARTWTDTYQLKNPTHGRLVDRKKVEAVKAAHETGGVSISSGWGYTWLEEIASKVMPTAHGTAHSARQLTRGVKVPGKYFAIARCFRPDVLDATHLIEFNQTDGFIVGEDLNFRHLLGVLEQFAKEIAGAEKVKFVPDYYPFTEPSVQLSAKHPQLGWVELGGAGMFRPEMLENLGIKGQAIAWGIGIDRLAMFKLGIRDIRYLFSDDLNWLRKMPLVME